MTPLLCHSIILRQLNSDCLTMNPAFCYRVWSKLIATFLAGKQ